MLVLAALVGPACGAFGSSDDAAPVSAARSVNCGGQVCTDDDFCCLGGGGETTCAPSCAERTFVCDDLADCSGGLVCCVAVNANEDRLSATVSGATCRAEADCQESATGTGATNLRGCNPRAPDCKGLGCAELTRRYPTVFPSSHVFVCD